MITESGFYNWEHERVEYAASELDRIKPDWWRHIDPLTLDLHDHRRCLCGQNGLGWIETSQLATDPEKFRLGSCSSMHTVLWLEEIAKRMPVREPALV